MPAVDDPSRVVRVQGQDGKTSAPREIAYTNCKVVGNGSFGVVFMAKLVRSQQLTAVKSESKAQGEARSAAGETTTTTTSSSEPSAENGQQQQQAAGSSSSPSSSSSPPKSDGAPAGPIEVVEDIAIKKVLQDKRFKVRSASILQTLLASFPSFSSVSFPLVLWSWRAFLSRAFRSARLSAPAGASSKGHRLELKHKEASPEGVLRRKQLPRGRY